MTQAQLGLYRREWNLARRVLRGRGVAAPMADSERHACHLRALGVDKSSLELTNKEFDRVLIEFRAISASADLGPQLEGQDQPAKRCRFVILGLCRKLGKGLDYAESIAQWMNREGKWGRLEKSGIGDLDEGRLKKVIVALRKQVKRAREVVGTVISPQRAQRKLESVAEGGASRQESEVKAENCPF